MLVEARCLEEEPLRNITGVLPNIFAQNRRANVCVSFLDFVSLLQCTSDLFPRQRTPCTTKRTLTSPTTPNFGYIWSPHPFLCNTANRHSFFVLGTLRRGLRTFINTPALTVDSDSSRHLVGSKNDAGQLVNGAKTSNGGYPGYVFDANDGQSAFSSLDVTAKTSNDPYFSLRLDALFEIDTEHVSELFTSSSRACSCLILHPVVTRRHADFSPSSLFVHSHSGDQFHLEPRIKRPIAPKESYHESAGHNFPEHRVGTCLERGREAEGIWVGKDAMFKMMVCLLT